MSLETTKKITLDFYNKNYVTVDAKQYDNKSRYILITCTDHGKEFSLNSSSMSAWIRYKKADKLGVFNDCTITNDGKILVELSEQMLAAPGKCTADLMILEKTFTTSELPFEFIDIKDVNAPILSTMSFYINVAPSALEHSEIESSYEFNALTNALANLDYQEKAVIELKKQIGEYGNSIFVGTMQECEEAIANGTLKVGTVVIIIGESDNDESIVNPGTYGDPGLYDENKVMIASWDELVNDYGMDVEKDYGLSVAEYDSSPYCVLTNNNLRGELIIDDSITKIGGDAFRECTNLTGVTIGNGVTSIGGSAFEGCANLTSVTIPNSVTSVGLFSFAFANCTSLKTAYVDADIDEIGLFAYSGSEEGFTVTFGRSLKTTPNIFGTYRNGDNNPDYASNVSKIIISSNITSISDYAFDNCASLTNVEIPDSVTSIGTWSFGDCTNLTSVTIPNGVTSIGEYAFYRVPHIYYNGTATGAPWGALAMN